jgi:hypothetical protein
VSDNSQQHTKGFVSNALKRTASRFEKVEIWPKDASLETKQRYALGSKESSERRTFHQFVEVEESRDSKETSEDEMQETARETDVEMKDSLTSAAARDTNMENASIAEEQSMDIEGQDGYSDDDTVPQSTKDSTNGKSRMHQSHSTAPSTLQSENQQIYMDLHLIVPENPKEKGPPEVIAMLKRRILEFMKHMQELEPCFKLHTINPEAKNIMTLDSPQKLPIKLPEIQDIFLNAKPLQKGGNLDMKVLVSHDCSTEELTAQTDWFHQDAKERFKKCALQVLHTANAGWHQYSFLYTDSDLLQLELTSKIIQQVELCWMIINDGTRTTGVDWNSLPKALHVFCDKNQLDYVQKQLSKIYRSKATKFPMKTKMRFVKPIRSLCNQDSIMKYKALRHDQHIWCEHAHRRTVTGITDLERISGKQGDKMTLKSESFHSRWRYGRRMDPQVKPKSSRQSTKPNEEQATSLPSTRTLKR